MPKRFTYQTKIKRTGVFDFTYLYSMIYNYFQDIGYTMIEKSYSEKVGSQGKEITIGWSPYKKVTDYFRFNIDVKWLVLNLKEIEIVKDGKKIKINSGTFQIIVTGYVITDHKKKWDGTWIGKKFRDMYDNYIIRARIDEYEDKVVEELDELSQRVKNYLSMANTF